MPSVFLSGKASQAFRNYLRELIDTTDVTSKDLVDAWGCDARTFRRLTDKHSEQAKPKFKISYVQATASLLGVEAETLSTEVTVGGGKIGSLIRDYKSSRSTAHRRRTLYRLMALATEYVRAQFPAAVARSKSLFITSGVTISAQAHRITISVSYADAAMQIMVVPQKEAFLMQLRSGNNDVVASEELSYTALTDAVQWLQSRIIILK